MTPAQKAAHLEERIRQGFDESTLERLRCSQCEACFINNVATHEHGCPRQNRRMRDDHECMRAEDE